MASLEEKARTSAQGAYLADQVGSHFHQIMIVIALSFIILAIFTPTSLLLNPTLITDRHPGLCASSLSKELLAQVFDAEARIKEYEQQLIRDHSLDIETIYLKLDLNTKIETRYSAQIQTSQDNLTIRRDSIIPIPRRPSL